MRIGRAVSIIIGTAATVVVASIGSAQTPSAAERSPRPEPPARPAARAVQPERTDVPYGRTPTVDGAAALGEWEDAATATIAVEPGWEVPVRFKHDGERLHVLFTNLKREDAELYPEVLLDIAGDGAATWQADDWWIHASYQDCEDRGRYGTYQCSPVKPGWTANNFPLEGPGTVEIAISFGKLGLDAAAGDIGIAFNVTDTRSRYHFWPRSATIGSPATWAAATAPTGWRAPVDAPAERGALVPLRVPGTAPGDTLEATVYLPPGYEAGRRYPTLYAVFAEPYLSLGRVRLAEWLDSAVVAGLPPAIVVGVPGPPTLDGARPDTEEGAAYRRFIATELVPAVERRHAALAERAARGLIGFSAGANVAVDVAVHHPDIFGAAAAQSPGWMFWSQEAQAISADFTREAARSAEAAPALDRASFWFVWGDADDEWEARSRRNGAEMIRALRTAGADVDTGSPIPGGHGLHQIRASLHEALRFLARSR